MISNQVSFPAHTIVDVTAETLRCFVKPYILTINRASSERGKVWIAVNRTPDSRMLKRNYICFKNCKSELGAVSTGFTE